MLNQDEPDRLLRQIRTSRGLGGDQGFPPTSRFGSPREVGTRHLPHRRTGWIMGGNNPHGQQGDDDYFAVHLILLDIHIFFRNKPRQYLATAFPHFLEGLRREVNLEAIQQTQQADSELQKLARLLSFDLELSTMCREIFNSQVLDRSRKLWGHQGERLAASSPVVADD